MWECDSAHRKSAGTVQIRMADSQCKGYETLAVARLGMLRFLVESSVRKMHNFVRKYFVFLFKVYLIIIVSPPSLLQLTLITPPSTGPLAIGNSYKHFCLLMWFSCGWTTHRVKCHSYVTHM